MVCGRGRKGSLRGRPATTTISLPCLRSLAELSCVVYQNDPDKDSKRSEASRTANGTVVLETFLSLWLSVSARILLLYFLLGLFELLEKERLFYRNGRD